ncbi:MAG: hypothetical protein L6Q54_06285 [Leptospiraceae bacterium]|nr:hypothetical protein [Leptospiraceae bacterium]MCK6380844.1 hypothetical protein [Leptospiraceae bacterium]
MSDKKRHYKESLYAIAFSLYITGKFDNAEKLSAHLVSSGHKITSNTIRSWMSEKDLDGLTWEDRKIQVVEDIRKNSFAVAKLERETLLGELSQILSGVFDDVKSNALQFRTKDAAIYSATNLIQLMRQLESKDDKLKNPLYVIQFYTDILSEIPSIRKALTQNQTKLKKLLSERLLSREEKAVE